MQFGLYHKNKGVITAEELIAALAEKQAKMVRLGQLAMEENILTTREVFAVLRHQRELPSEFFGEAAVSMGLLKPAELYRLLALQGERQPALADILVRQQTLRSVLRR